MSLRDLLDLRILSFAFFMMAGNFKGDPRIAWFPVDLTLLAGGLTLVLCVQAFIERGFKIPDRMHLLAALFFVFAIPLVWTELALAYPFEKSEKLFTFTALAAFAPFFLLNGPEDHRRFLNVVALLGLVMLLEAASKLGSGPLLRLTSFDSNEIALGRAAGLVLVWFAILALEGRTSPFIAFPVVGLAAILMLFSGSRGPFISALGLLGFMGVVFYRARLKQLLLFGVTIALTGSAIYLSASFAPGGSLGRIESFIRGDLGGSEMTRVEYAVEAIDTLQRNPLGIGWGGVAVHLGNGGGGYREYPHNFLLETTVEAGWLGGVTLLVVCFAAWRRISCQPATVETRGVHCLLLFMVVNACVSGDLNDNKFLFCLLGMSMAYQRPEETEPEAIEAPEPLAQAA